MFVKFEKDTMIYPKESAWFQQVDHKGKVLPLNATDFYNHDYIGLKNMTESNKIEYVKFDNDHLQFTDIDIKEVVIPFLISWS